MVCHDHLARLLDGQLWRLKRLSTLLSEAYAIWYSLTLVRNFHCFEKTAISWLEPCLKKSISSVPREIDVISDILSLCENFNHIDFVCINGKVNQAAD